jgi:cysteine synthase
MAAAEGLLISQPAASLTALERMEGLSQLIGNTPLVAIDYELRGSQRTVYAKCEQMNLTGSIKDRMVHYILKKAYATGQLHAGDTIVEVSSGNTGISCAAIGRAMGHPVVIFMPDWMSVERVKLMESYGARVVLVSREQGGFLGCLRGSEEFAAAHAGTFLPRQFDNAANVEEHWQGTGPEIWEQLELLGLETDAFVAAVGTGGTVMGVGGFLRSKRPGVRIHPVEPAESPVLSNPDRVGHHRIEGIAEEFLPSIVDLGALDAPVAVSDGDAILAAQSLAGQLGLGVGISSGCNFLAAVGVQRELGPQSVVVTVFADDNKKYLSTDLMRREAKKTGYLSPEIALLGMRSVSPVRRLTQAPIN